MLPIKRDAIMKSMPDANDEMDVEYRFDYSKAKPNRFAERLTGDRTVVVLDPDVAEVFTSTAAVNDLLRAIIRTLPPASPAKQ